ncbi:hypothetical protein [Bradyrhizobium sp. OK095]|jgi:hypothetical protein|uniref:hypothetical protein n=1 Tax=Bradyrhizobium sp. OK095 TaxID=1882760 RepID=UPI0008D73F19|nr:hypothetical protein [Bradyrhizobium sp. OK095]SEM23521.1 hypothetical protein SAMN05443254_101303 [Bradyrhizobium sp. OK095]
MTRFLVASFVVLALIVAAATIFRGQPRAIELSTAAMPSLIELHTMAGVHRLPDQDIDDQSLIFPAKAKQ